jgi:hypothetical protein
MKILKFLSSLLLFMTFASTALAQSGPPAPSNGIWAIIDTNYTVGTSVQGHTTANLTLQNTTVSKITGVQFRVFYDKNAFSAASVSLIGSPTNLYLQSIDNNTNGYVTITLVYTGSSAVYTIPNGERFSIDFTHIVPSSSFQALAAISNLTWSGVNVYSQVASEQPGNDIALSLHNYGGIFQRPDLNYHGTFTNVTGSAAKNLHLALEKKPKTSNVWTQHASYITDINGDFQFTETIDTTFWDVRLALQGDTMGVGNVISVADAQQVNQWVIGGSTPQSWDYYTADVNGDNNITISDAWGLFGRISGRFATWTNNVKDVKFFSVSEYNTITGTPATNYTSTIAGQTNFYFNILPGQPDSVTFYVLVPGDANNTGYHMARLVPIEIENPTNAPTHLIDESVLYDFAVDSMEVNVPSLSVEEGNLVKLPVKVFTNGYKIGSLQLSLLFDSELLEFIELTNSEKSMKWISFINPMNGIVEWGGYDATNNENLFIDGETVFTLNFLAKKPQGEWAVSPLYTTRKFVGNENSTDMQVTPTNGVYEVKSLNGVELKENQILVYPNPTTGEVIIKFNVPVDGNVNLSFVDGNGKKAITVFEQYMPSGNYSYSASLRNLVPGTYYTTLMTSSAISVSKTVLQK